MKTMEVTVVRIYLTEGEHKLPEFLKRLHDIEKVRGVTVFRGICGFGKSGMMHSSGLLDLSLDLPLVIEFFDAPDRVISIMSHLDDLIDPGHMLSWQAQLNTGNE